MAKKVFIGCGHGGSDPGAVANGFKEKDLNLVIGLACADELSQYGVTVLTSRTKDENDLLADVIKDCNNFNPDVAVDVHNNAGGGDGAEVFHTYKGGEGKTLAQNILAEIVAIGQNSRGTKTKKNKDGKDYFGFIREIKAPSVIVECAFLDNKNDIKIIDTEAEQKAMGVAIAKGILKTLGITKKPEPEIKPEADDMIYCVQVGIYTEKAKADDMVAKLKAAGFNAIIKEEKGDIESLLVEEPWIPKVGDKVMFTGNTVYSSSIATKGSECSKGEAIITIIADGKKHPYHLKRTGKTGAYGWVDAGTFTKI